MSKELDAGLSFDDVALRVGHLVLTNWGLGKKVEVLETRVDELDPPEGVKGA